MRELKSPGCGRQGKIHDRVGLSHRKPASLLYIYITMQVDTYKHHLFFSLSFYSQKMEFIPEETYYGKSAVKLLRLRAEGNVHHIKEFEVNVHLSLSSKKDFESGDNSDIIATDTQKNTVYALAKLVGVSLLKFGYLTMFGLWS